MTQKTCGKTAFVEIHLSLKKTSWANRVEETVGTGAAHKCSFFRRLVQRRPEAGCNRICYESWLLCSECISYFKNKRHRRISKNFFFGPVASKPNHCETQQEYLWAILAVIYTRNRKQMDPIGFNPLNPLWISYAKMKLQNVWINSSELRNLFSFAQSISILPSDMPRLQEAAPKHECEMH